MTAIKNLMKVMQLQDAVAENQVKNNDQNSVVKSPKRTTIYCAKNANPLEQEYYNKMSGCSVKAQENNLFDYKRMLKMNRNYFGLISNDQFIMKAEKKINNAILKITMKIREQFPELSKYMMEMPVTIPNKESPEMNNKILHEYYNSLDVLLKDYINNQHVAIK